LYAEVSKELKCLCMTSIGAVRSSANNALYGHSVDTVASHYEEERLFDSLEELEAQIIGNLLPSDDDFLSGMTNELELDHIIQDSSGDDMDELDLFSSVGGMDLGDDNTPSSGQKNSKILDGAFNSQLGLCSALIDGEQPHDKHPSRTLVVRNINSDVEDSELRSLFEVCFCCFLVLLFLLEHKLIQSCCVITGLFDNATTNCAENPIPRNTESIFLR